MSIRKKLEGKLSQLMQARSYRPENRYRRVCIYKPDRIGDAVLATGAVHEILQEYGVDDCVLVGSAFTKELLQPEFPGLEFITIGFGHDRRWKTLMELWRLRSTPLFSGGVDLLISLRHQRYLRDTMILRAIPSGTSIGVQNSLTELAMSAPPADLDYRFDHVVAAPPPTAFECRELAAHRGVLSAVLRRPIAADGILPRLSHAAPGSSGEVVVSPFGSAKIRDIPASLLIMTCRIASDLDYMVKFLAEPAAPQRYEAAAAAVRAAGVKNVRVEIQGNLQQLVRTISHARLVISAETSTAHIAAAQDRALIAFLGGGHFGWFAPWRRSHRQFWLSHDVECRGCGWRCRQRDVICLTEISDHELEKAVRGALS